MFGRLHRVSAVSTEQLVVEDHRIETTRLVVCSQSQRCVLPTTLFADQCVSAQPGSLRPLRLSARLEPDSGFGSFQEVSATVYTRGVCWPLFQHPLTLFKQRVFHICSAWFQIALRNMPSQCLELVQPSPQPPGRTFPIRPAFDAARCAEFLDTSVPRTCT